MIYQGKQQVLIGMLLVAREVRMILASWKSVLVDIVINAFFMSLLAGYFMPTMGMPEHFIAPLLLGTLLNALTSIAFTYAMGLGHDFTGARMMQYHTTLPTSVSVVCGAVVVGSVIRMLLFFYPLLVGALWVSGIAATLSISWGAFLVHSVLVSAFETLLFYTIATWWPMSFLLGSCWPRIIVPLYVFGCAFFPLSAATSLPVWAQYLVRLSPLTYCVEGLRASLIGGVLYDPILKISGILALFCVALWMLFVRGMRWRLQSVEGGV